METPLGPNSTLQFEAIWHLMKTDSVRPWNRNTDKKNPPFRPRRPPLRSYRRLRIATKKNKQPTRTAFPTLRSRSHTNQSTMSDSVQEILDVPREFVKDGVQFLNRCQKRKCFFSQTGDTHHFPQNALADVFFSLGSQPTRRSSGRSARLLVLVS